MKHRLGLSAGNTQLHYSVMMMEKALFSFNTEWNMVSILLIWNIVKMLCLFHYSMKCHVIFVCLFQYCMWHCLSFVDGKCTVCAITVSNTISFLFICFSTACDVISVLSTGNILTPGQGAPQTGTLGDSQNPSWLTGQKQQQQKTSFWNTVTACLRMKV